MCICAFVYFVIITMCSECLRYIRCLCVMNYLVKPECWVPIKHVLAILSLHDYTFLEVPNYIQR